MSRYNLDMLDDAELVQAGINEKLYLRRSRESHSTRLDAIWAECGRRAGDLWGQVLSGVLEEEAKVRESNRLADEALRAMHPEERS